jgi:hypothetical protein
MNNLLEILRDPAWEGIAALIAIFVLVLPFVVKAIKFLSFNQNILAFIKNIASVALAVSCFLPLSCYHQGPPSDVYAYKSIIAIFEASTFNLTNFLFSIITLIAFIWPVLFVFYYSYGHRSKIKSILKAIEPLLCLCTFYVLLIMTMGKLLFGGYVAFLSIMSYFISSLLERSSGVIYVVRVSIIVIFLSFMWPTIHDHYMFAKSKH